MNRRQLTVWLAIAVAVVWLSGGVAHSQTIVVEFNGDNCPSCEQMKPIVGDLLSSGQTIYAINVSQRSDYAKLFGYDGGGVPQFVVWDTAKKEVVRRQVGACSRQELERFIGGDAVASTTRPTVRTVSVPRTDGLRFTWRVLKAVRNVGGMASESLRDIDSHLPAGHIYRNDSDLVNWAHETTHGINSRGRNELVGNRINAFYCLGDKLAVFREPRVRKSDVCRYVAANHRGPGWGLYMAGQTEWDDTPLYILDEWSAYLNGAVVHLELVKRGMRQDRSLDADLNKCNEFAWYAHALLQCVDAQDRSYPDREPLGAFIDYQTDRARQLLGAER
jgi:thiol-disulfide isomerase/thioredoxin